LARGLDRSPVDGTAAMPDLNLGVIEQWGNFPQTYSMVGLIVCTMRLSKSWEEAFWRGW
jgi:hypothetical protein